MLKSITNNILKLVEEKDRNYNHAFDKACDEFGNLYALTKLHEKYHRINNFIKNNIDHEESLKDSLYDLVGYSLLLLRRLENCNLKDEIMVGEKISLDDAVLDQCTQVITVSCDEVE